MITRFKTVTAAVAATSLALLPVAASASAQPLRADTSVSGQAMGEEAGGSWLYLLAAAALGLGVYFLFIDDNSPTSP